MSLEKIVNKLKKQIGEFEPKMEISETGQILEIGDGICRLSGLNKCQSSEMLLFPQDTVGLALNLEEDTIGAVILGKYQHLKEGDVVKRTGRYCPFP